MPTLRWLKTHEEPAPEEISHSCHCQYTHVRGSGTNAVPCPRPSVACPSTSTCPDQPRPRQHRGPRVATIVLWMVTNRVAAFNKTLVEDTGTCLQFE